jgi:3-oxoacyl-[acyl-carrier protein] reductase
MDLELAGKVALVAGAGRGIGRAVALGLAREGARVAVLARSADEVRATAQAIRDAGGDALELVVDLAEEGAMSAAVSRVRDELGGVQILVLSAAAHYQVRKLHSLRSQDIDDLLAVDVRASTLLCQEVLGDMMLAGYGRIVGLGSLAARTGVPGGTVYSASKAYLEGLMRGLAVDYSRRGITANVVGIGFVETERVKSRIADDDDARARLEKGASIRRLLRPEEIADVVTFLCSARASVITGAVVDATGGAHLNNLW